jgi:amidase
MILSAFLAAASATRIVAAAADGTSASSFPSLYSATIEDITSGLENGDFTSVDLVKTYLARTAEVNDNLHVVIEMNPDAISIAASLDEERKNGKVRGPLHGIPILVKDNIATFDKMNNTAGSFALLGAKVPRDSGTVAKLRSGGAIILGKANMSQWYLSLLAFDVHALAYRIYRAMYRSTNTTSGWTARGGQTYGPFFPHMDPYVCFNLR